MPGSIEILEYHLSKAFIELDKLKKELPAISKKKSLEAKAQAVVEADFQKRKIKSKQS